MQHAKRQYTSEMIEYKQVLLIFLFILVGSTNLHNEFDVNINIQNAYLFSFDYYNLFVPSYNDTM